MSVGRGPGMAVVLWGILAGGSLARAASVMDGYQTPVLVVPYAFSKPVIDGTVDDQEWRDALSINALQSGSVLSPRQTQFWLKWDEDNLYLAMRSPLRPGERPIQANRRRDRDINVVFDDSYEIWSDFGTRTKEGLETYFQYLGNFAGARWDLLMEPAAGNWRMGYTAGWEPKNRLTPDGKAWEMEVVIPRQSVFVNEPFRDGFKFKALLVRNFKRPWEQNTLGKGGDFKVREIYSRLTLSKDAPAVQLLGVSNPSQQTLGLSLAACGRQSGKLRWSFRSDGGVNRTGELALQKDQAVALPPQLDLDKPGPGGFRIQVTSADGKETYLDFASARGFGDLHVLSDKLNDRGDEVELNLEYNPVHNYVRVNGDFINYDARGQIVRSHVTVFDARGKALAEADFVMDELAYVRGVLNLPQIPAGEYSTRLTCFGPDGKEVLKRESKFAKKDLAREFPWWNTPLGNIEKVLAPWTPVTFAKDEFGVWGRTLQVGPAGLPKRITTANRELLASAATLVAETADGQVLRAEDASLRIVSQAAHRVVVEVTSKLGDIKIQSLVTVEFDGLYKLNLKLEPQKPVALKSLKMVVPYRNEFADLLYAAGEGIRYGKYYGFVPKDKTGKLWNCLAVDGQPMAVGSFIPYVWLGNGRGGLCWFADSDEGWTPNDKVPAIELQRDGAQSTDLVLNLISAEETLAQPRTIVMGFETTPVKPMHRGWRMDPWWPGDTFIDFAAVQDHGGDLIFTSLPFTLDNEKCRKIVQQLHNATTDFTMGLTKYRHPAVPYFEHISIGAKFIPEMAYFGDEWRTSISRGFVYGKTFTDFMIYHLGTWAKECGIDGFYLDNVNPLACDNLDAGRGYKLPNGKVQPTYQIFDTRRYLLRLRAVFAEQGKHDQIVIHMTNNMIMPWIGAADLFFDGEDHAVLPEAGKDFMDYWTPERLRADYPGQLGVAGSFMGLQQGRWEPEPFRKVHRAYEGMVLLMDMLVSGDNHVQQVYRARDRFGMEADDVEFLPYWEPDTGISSLTKSVRISAWRHGQGGKLLLVVVNFGEKTDATVKLELAKFGPSATWKVSDAETAADLKADAQNQIVVPLERHDYRQIIIDSGK